MRANCAENHLQIVQTDQNTSKVRIKNKDIANAKLL